ncbi:MAG: redoxin domain-containing protein, partial [Planctomycetes bacterium]|nr:redoxin domain-containing protein [Planctomycetota bacterium]
MLTVTAIAGCSDGETQREGDTLSSPLRPAPELKGASAWLNTTKPLTLDDLRGQVVLLDFWTYCCINCLHVLPDLKYLEHKYRDDPFVVVGIHSGKFDEEKDAGNIRQAILRHNIVHPVAVDNDYEIWNAF